MAVNTPQLEVPVYQPKDMAQAPAMQNAPAQPLPAQAGFVPKSGAAAYVASNILDGWMKGREHAKQQELAKAQNQMQGADYTVDTLRNNYKDLLKQGKPENDPEVQKAKSAVLQAWNVRNQTMAQYAIPDKDDKSHKKGAKEKTEGLFSHVFGKGGITPQMIPQAALEILKNSPPPGMDLSPEDKRSMAQTETAEAETKFVKTQAEQAQLKLDQEKTKDAEDVAIKAIVTKPEADRTLADKDKLAGWQRTQHINDPLEKQLADKVLTKIQDGQALSDTERNFAYSQRLITAPQVTMRTGSNGMDQAITISPDGKVLSTTSLGRHYEPDQVGPAVRLAQAQQKMLYTLYDKGTPAQPNETPEARQQRVWGMVAADSTRNPNLTATFLTENPQQKEQDIDAVNKALRTVWTQAGGPGATKEERDAERARMSNFVLPGNDDDPANAGHFVFRQQVADPTGKKGYWWGDKEPEYAGGVVGKQKLATQQAALANQVRSVLQQQHPKWSPTDLDRVIPPWLSGRGGGPQGMQPTPGTGSPQAMQASPGSGQTYGTPGGANKKYTVRTSNGTSSTAYMTPDDAEMLRSQGAQVTE